MPNALANIQIILRNIPQEFSADSDFYAWLAVIQALVAASKNNFGVGAIIVDENGALVLHGHNQFFQPYFQNSLHAEMVLLDALEEKRQSKNPPIRYTLYTSLEPCMMCLARIIYSRMSTVYFVAQENEYGSVIDNKNLPAHFAALKEQQVITEMSCLPMLKNLSIQLIGYDVQNHLDVLDKR